MLLDLQAWFKENLKMGLIEATKSLDEGKALNKLNELINFSKEIK